MHDTAWGCSGYPRAGGSGGSGNRNRRGRYVEPGETWRAGTGGEPGGNLAAAGELEVTRAGDAAGLGAGGRGVGTEGAGMEAASINIFQIFYKKSLVPYLTGGQNHTNAYLPIPLIIKDGIRSTYPYPPLR